MPLSFDRSILVFGRCVVRFVLAPAVFAGEVFRTEPVSPGGYCPPMLVAGLGRDRESLRQNETGSEDFGSIYPLFVVEGEHICREIETLPDVYHYSVDCLPQVLDEMKEAGILSCILFGIPDHKDACGSAAYDANGIVQRAIRFIKEYAPEIYVIGDVCMCEYTDHGHCGILDEAGNVLNDETLSYLNRIALSYAAAGIDMVAPSDMMDGHIASIRSALDEQGYTDVAIMGYSAKYASSYYGPFRAAANSTPCFGDRKGYQMDFANSREALRELEADQSVII